MRGGSGIRISYPVVSETIYGNRFEKGVNDYNNGKFI